MYFGENALSVAIVASCLAWLGCGDSTDDPTTTGAGGTGAGAGGAGGSTTTTTGGGGSAGAGGSASSGGPGLQMTGTYNGAAFSASCLDGDDVAYQSQLQCFEAVQAVVGYCRTLDPSIGGAGQFQVWFSFTQAQFDAGSADFLATATTVTDGIQMGDGLAKPLQVLDANAATNSATFSAGSVAGPVVGTFEASWSDAGGDYGDVTATFDLDCTK